MPAPRARSLLATAALSLAAIALPALPLRAAAPLVCSGAPATVGSTGPTAATGTTTAGDPRTRAAAQHGIDWLARSTAAWGKQNRCFGCHVQAVTLEGLAVGKHHQYDVPEKEFAAIVDGMLHLPGGARSPEGFSHPGYKATPRTFGGIAFARYDQYIDGNVRDDLYRVAKQLLAYQSDDGAVHGDHQSYPVTTGVLQATYQAMQTWRQVYARSADEKWLPPLRKAEGYISHAAKGFGDLQTVYLQDVNYALLGLVAAGAGPTEPLPAKLVRHLLKSQQEDGGWGFNGASDAFATGQTVYALRMAGASDGAKSVSRGTTWLVAHQQHDGSWGAAGSAKAEALWAVLGLVSVDVLSVAIEGLSDGQRVEGVLALAIEAQDNARDNSKGGAKDAGGSVARLELLVDDLPIDAACGDHLSVKWDTSKLAPGKHLVDAVATNRQGQQSRRRLQIYAGDIFLTQIGARFEEGKTRVSLRNLAPAGRAGKVRFEVFAADAAGQPKGAPVYSAEEPSAPGAMGFAFAGKKPGRYLGVLTFHDTAGKALQRETTLFVQDTEEAQKKAYGEVQGALSLSGGRPAANALVELLDDKGQVVQVTRSTEAGQYRFKGVDRGDFKVRVHKDGFGARDAAVSAAPAQEAAANVALE